MFSKSFEWSLSVRLIVIVLCFQGKLLHNKQFHYKHPVMHHLESVMLTLYLSRTIYTTKPSHTIVMLGPVVSKAFSLNGG